MNREWLACALVVVALIIIIMYTSHTEKCTRDDDKIKSLLRQSIRWSVAAQQDSNPIIRNLHANYGVGYLNALKETFSDCDIQRVFNSMNRSPNIDYHIFQNFIVGEQDASVRNLIDRAPHLSPIHGEIGSLSNVM